MRRAAIFFLLLLVLPEARAGWTDLREGADSGAVIAALGEPLIRSRSRSGTFESWTYDAGGYAVFVNARLSHWEVSRGAARPARASTADPRALGLPASRPAPAKSGMPTMRRSAPMR